MFKNVKQILLQLLFLLWSYHNPRLYRSFLYFCHFIEEEDEDDVDDSDDKEEKEEEILNKSSFLFLPFVITYIHKSHYYSSINFILVFYSLQNHWRRKQKKHKPMTFIGIDSRFNSFLSLSLSFSLSLALTALPYQYIVSGDNK